MTRKIASSALALKEALWSVLRGGVTLVLSLILRAPGEATLPKQVAS